MSESGSIQDKTIYGLVKLLTAQDKELKDSRSKIKELELKLDEAERKLGTRNSSTHTRKTEPLTTESEPTSIESTFSEEFSEKRYQNNLNNVASETSMTSKPVETSFLSATSREKAMINPFTTELSLTSGVDTENTDESITFRKEIEDENRKTNSITATQRRIPCRLSCKELSRDETTKKRFKRYRISRRTVKKKNISTKNERSGDIFGEGHVNFIATLRSRPNHAKAKSLTGLQNGRDCNTSMFTFNDGFQYEGSEYVLSSSYNDHEMICKTMNGQNKTLTDQSSTHGILDGFGSVCSPRRSGDQVDAVPPREITIVVPASCPCSRHFCIEGRSSESATGYVNGAGEVSDNFGIAETSVQPPTTDDYNNESFA